MRIPEESQPPDVLQRAAALQHTVRAAHPDLATSDSSAGVAALLQDAPLLTAHRHMLPPPRRPGIDPLNVALLTGAAKLQETDSFAKVWSDLNAAEKVAVLSDAQALQGLLALR